MKTTKMMSTYKKIDAGSMNKTNKKAVLKIIKENDQISRSGISKEIGLTPPSVTRIVDELVHKEKLVEYVGIGNSSGGRPPVVVRFKNKNNFIIGIDLGATYIRGCMVDLNANFISEIQVPTEIEKGLNSVIEKLVQITNKLISRKSPEGKIWGVGIGVAGLVNKETGIIEASPDFKWTHSNLRELLEDKINIPFFYDNSTRLMASGELYFNNNKNLSDFAVINVGYGIAAGIVIGGKIIKGHLGFAGEFGHIPVDNCSNVQCKCGMFGCLEALASGNRIVTLANSRLNDKNAEILRDLYKENHNTLTAEIVAKAAKKGDLVSSQIYEEITDYLCRGIGTITNLLNPEVIYIGGGIALNGDFFFDLINSKKDKYLLSPNSGLQILPATFGEQATSIGAVSLIMEKIMNLEL